MADPTPKPEGTFWNGLPTVAERGTAIVAPAPQFPMYWARHLVGQRIAVVRVELDGVAYGGGTDYLDDVDGAGWRKVTEGKGGPGWPHSNVSIVDGSFQPLKTTERGEADPALLLILLAGILGALVVAGVLAAAGALG